MVSAIESTESFMPFSVHRGVVRAGEQSCVLVGIEQRLTMNASLYFRKRADCPQSGADGAMIILCMRVRTGYVRLHFGFLQSHIAFFCSFALLDIRQVIDLDVLHGVRLQFKINLMNESQELLPSKWQQSLAFIFLFIKFYPKEPINMAACISFDSGQETTRQLEKEPHTESQLEIINPQGSKEESSRIKENHSKKIKIRGHYKTEVIQEVSRHSAKSRLKTSPHKESVPLARSDVNRFMRVASSTQKLKPFLSHWQCPEREGSTKENLSYSDLMPKQKTIAVSFSRTNKNLEHLSSYIKRDDDGISSKSKKKIEFTVYQQRKKSKSKENSFSESIKQSSPLKHSLNICKLPYPYTQNIAINLFRSDEKARSKSKERSLSREQSTGKQSQLHKKLNKAKSSAIIDSKIQNAMEKLAKFQIVKDNADSLQIQGMLQGYQIAGEPECKWVLLVIDQVFKKMRKPASH